MVYFCKIYRVLKIEEKYKNMEILMMQKDVKIAEYEVLKNSLQKEISEKSIFIKCLIY